MSPPTAGSATRGQTTTRTASRASDSRRAARARASAPGPFGPAIAASRTTTTVVKAEKNASFEHRVAEKRDAVLVQLLFVLFLVGAADRRSCPALAAR